MSRLIDADELKERFCEENCGKNRCVDHMDKCAWILSVEESKTAFDVDKVISELKRDKFIESECILSDVHQEYNAGLNRAIEIVKGGGVE